MCGRLPYTRAKSSSPAKGVVADVTRNLLAAHAYVGPGKQHASWLHGNHCALIPREQFPAEAVAIDAIVAKVAESGRAVPLCWRQCTLALGAAEGKPEDAIPIGGPAEVSAWRTGCPARWSRRRARRRRRR